MRRRFILTLPLAAFLLLAGAGGAEAGFLGFGDGIGPAMWYGPYTGGHGYSYNVAYSYGLAFSSADTWRRDPVAYPYGPYPYPYGPYPPRRFVCYTVPPGTIPAQSVVVAPGGEVLALQPVPSDGTARIRVSVPSSAEVWFEDNKTAQTGGERTFRSPQLPPGRSFIYTVRARWTAGGREMEQIQVVDVSAGQDARIVFPRARP